MVIIDGSGYLTQSNSYLKMVITLNNINNYYNRFIGEGVLQRLCSDLRRGVRPPDVAPVVLPVPVMLNS